LHFYYTAVLHHYSILDSLVQRTEALVTFFLKIANALSKRNNKYPLEICPISLYIDISVAVIVVVIADFASYLFTVENNQSQAMPGAVTGKSLDWFPIGICARQTINT
jgi:hypothetical protein